MAKTNINAFVLPRYSDNDTLTMVIKLTLARLGYRLSFPHETIGQMIADARLCEIPVTIGNDAANSHDTMSDNSGTNEHGKCLFDFLTLASHYTGQLAAVLAS